MGVFLVDIGGETTDIVIYVDGAIAYSSVIPIGARHITSDLAVGLRVSLESAEKIKLYLGKTIKTPAVPDLGDKLSHKDEKKPKEDFLDARAIGIVEELQQKLTKDSVVNSIIRPRIQEIFELVGKEIKRSGFASQVPSGLVICGGGAQTVGVLDQAKRYLGFPARLGRVEGLVGLTDEIDSPAFATAAGLIMYGAKSTFTPQFNLPVLAKGIPIKEVMQRGISLIKSFLP